MKKKEWLVCSKCGKKDVTDKSVIPHHIGTQTHMMCPHCSEGKVNSYGTPIASMCRNCCPTEHGTKFTGFEE